MSHHLEHKPNLPKPEKMPDPTALGEHNITITDIQKGKCGCGCKCEDLRPSRLKQLQEQYETAIAECKAATKQLIDKVLSLEFVEATEAEIYAMFNDVPPTPTPEPTPDPEPVDDGILHLNALTEVDGEGYIPVGNISVDDDGYIPMAENISIDEDGYLIEE